MSVLPVQSRDMFHLIPMPGNARRQSKDQINTCIVICICYPGIVGFPFFLLLTRGFRELTVYGDISWSVPVSLNAASGSLDLSTGESTQLFAIKDELYTTTYQNCTLYKSFRNRYNYVPTLPILLTSICQ
ncbi:uncharacterized protein KLLA0_E22177g [Kluyveromyces lactis]|uniref:KLLA0E22177p n=1 Tax=Kluyveromyces lactis (strain ATCC 8585 / CBS 2359 / DSM 70799 / NBRC 1267 / NRRL Y-1140 / WM37) TaxID=284590 RepID=Q6CM84_KLULA|nr:uncharacterized protein KLLA0_E22177g [Kluyveromyces lactis]CAH00042.1 KLLA0E22177p [Kluyveromyces lactis]|eukprot:XP_454955.1 uncharacterized protein KLLA0_E22177g [Kluyveromyces lactis]